VRSAFAVLAATLVVAAGTGCSDNDGGNEVGGDSSSRVTVTNANDPAESTATRPEPAPGQSRWAGQIDDVCKPIQEQIDAVPPPADAAGLEAWLADVVPLVHKQVAAVKAIKPPVKAEEARRAKLFLGSLQKLDVAFTRYLAAVRAGKPKAIETALTAASTAGSQARAYAISLGVTQCGGYSND
jgi:hypothetical protein